jgi:hypothetical protein
MLPKSRVAAEEVGVNPMFRELAESVLSGGFTRSPAFVGCAGFRKETQFGSARVIPSNSIGMPHLFYCSLSKVEEQRQT